MTAHNSISSNAFNSTSFVRNGVDPRTGLYTVTIDFPELNGNLLNGPALPLGLSFSPTNILDSGFGIGWDLSLTQFNPTTRVLSLCSGETYKVTGSGAEPEIAEHKLDSFKLFDQGGGHYRVVHKSGLVELLEERGISSYVLAQPVEIQSPDGHSLTLDYEPYGNFQRLRQVKQADGSPLLLVRYNSGVLNISYLGGASDRTLATYILMLDTSNSRLKQLILPTDDGACWTFDYDRIGDYTCLKNLRSPQGALEAIVHDGRHPFPGSTKPGLPRVTSHVLDPGREQPVTETRYTYSSNNFLGNNASSLTWRDDGLDNLYRVTEAYEYYSIQTRYEGDVAGRTVKSTYNRYHLLTEQVTTHGNARLINATEYYLDDNLPFDLQVPQCQMPRKTLSRWTLVDDPTSLRDEVETTRFDAFGNKIEHIDASGIRQTWTYYSALGEPGCPADPHGFCRQAKEHRRYPAAPPPTVAPAKVRLAGALTTPIKRKRPTPGYNDEPVLITRFAYTTHPPLTGGPVPALVLDTSTYSALTALGEQELVRSTYRFFDCPDIAERHGKPHTTLEARNGHLCTVTHEYDYAARVGCLTHKEQVSYDLDGTTIQSLECLELYTGMLLEEHTVEGRILRYEYDAIQRIVSEEVTSADARYPAICRYRYSWPTANGRFAEHTVVDAEGVESIKELDGLGRKIRERRQKPDGSADQAPLQLVYSARYGHEMQLLEETEHDWLDEEPRVLTRRFEYDEWDQQCREVDARGVGTNTLVDPFEMTVTEWQDGMARTVTRNNRFGKPESVYTYCADPARGQSWETRERSFYDCYGQLRRHLANNGGCTLYDYDVLGRLRHQQLPDSTRVTQQYAEHSHAALITELHVTQSQRARATTLVGSQRFDGLERVTQRTEGPRTTQFAYRGNLDVIDERITPAQRTIRYEYDLSLSNEATATHADESCTFEYHPITAALIKAHSPHSSLEYRYDRAGRLASERSQVDGTTREISYSNSSQGRLLQQVERVATRTLETTVKYDAYGRIAQTSEGQLRSDFEYDSRGQLARTTTQDLASPNWLVTELEHDDFGREILRTQRLTGSAEHQTALIWALDGRLQRRDLRIGGALALGEGFLYDLRGRLIEHTCNGPELPTDPYGNPIIRQRFDFDGLDNLMFCASDFADGSWDEALYFYADDDPCQLRSLTHTHPGYPAETQFSYDADGNLIKDANGYGMEYDRQGRLLQVNHVGGAPLTRYRYDAHDHLLGVTRGMETETLRFYQGNQVRSIVEGEHIRSFSYADQVPLGEQWLGEPDETLLTLCGESNSVLAELKDQGPVKRTVYTSYGDTREVLQSALGFNGELREEGIGWYLLGKGYRAYDAQLRRFHSPDSASPFGAGGLNPYAYCQGDPIGLSDPTGHFAHPGSDERMFKDMVAASASKNANISFGIGLALSVVSSVVLAPLTGGLSLAAFAGWLAFDVAELTVRTAVNMDRQKKGITSDAPFFKYWDTGMLILMGVSMATAAGDAIERQAAKYGDKQALKRAKATLASRLGAKLDHNTFPRIRENTHPRRTPLAAALEPDVALAGSAQSDIDGPFRLIKRGSVPELEMRQDDLVPGSLTGRASAQELKGTTITLPPEWQGSSTAMSTNQAARQREVDIRRKPSV